MRQQFVCLIESLLDEPFLRREVAHFGEVTFEGGEAAPGVSGKFLQRHILRVVRLHEGKQVNLSRFVEVEQRGIKACVGIKQAIKSLLHFQLDDFVFRFDVRVRVREKR